MLSDKSMCLHLSQGRVSRQVCSLPRQRRNGLRKVFASRYRVQTCPQTSRRLPPPLAHQELYEWRGEAVRCAAALCNARFLARSLSSDLSRLHSDYFFCTRHVLTTYFRASFSVGLRRAKITEVRAKEGLCLSLLRSGLPSDLSACPLKLAPQPRPEKT